jgi:hypothetical protein
MALALIDAGLRASGLATVRWPAVRLRALAVSLLVIAVASQWAVERTPW